MSTTIATTQSGWSLSALMIKCIDIILHHHMAHSSEFSLNITRDKQGQFHASLRAQWSGDAEVKDEPARNDRIHPG